MVRTQIQLPETTYAELKRLAKAKEWTMAEAVRRSVDELLRVYPDSAHLDQDWQFPILHAEAPPSVPVEKWRALANGIED